jgi:hypothetical protein
VLRASLHPGGLARRIRNRAQWRAHLLSRLRRQIESFLPHDDTTRARLEVAIRQSTAGDVSRGPAP